MAENTKIEWATHTFNPWVGCSKVSPACDGCYAEEWALRYGQVQWGPHADRRRTKTWGNPVKWNKQAVDLDYRPRVFCASLADVGDNHKSILPEWRTDLWKLIKATPNLDWLLLTKRPQNIARYLPDDWGEGYPNVWLGCTVENQEEAVRRIALLLRIPAVIHWLSMEPLLSRVDLEHIYMDHPAHWNALTGQYTNEAGVHQNAKIDWVVTGGESGNKFRHAEPDWFRSLRDQCAANDTPFLFKQWEGKTQAVIKAQGRELDGVVHDGYPTSTAAAQ